MSRTTSYMSGGYTVYYTPYQNINIYYKYTKIYVSRHQPNDYMYGRVQNKRLYTILRSSVLLI